MAFLETIGGFDDALGTGTRSMGGDDLAALHRAVATGHDLVYEPAAIVFHRHHDNLAALRRQAYGYGAGLTACRRALALCAGGGIEARRDLRIGCTLVTQQQRQRGEGHGPLDHITKKRHVGEFGQQIARQQATHAHAQTAAFGRPTQVSEHLGLARAGGEQVHLPSPAGFVRLALEHSTECLFDKCAVVGTGQLANREIAPFGFNIVLRGDRISRSRGKSRRAWRASARGVRFGADFRLDLVEVIVVAA